MQQLLWSQTWPEVQVSVHVMVPPHPSETLPQATPRHAVPGVSGVQQLLPRQTWPEVQMFVHNAVQYVIAIWFRLRRVRGWNHHRYA